MLRRKSDHSPLRPCQGADGGDIDVMDFPRFAEEMSPREVMAKLTLEFEKRVDASFGRKPKALNS
jgi:hypothetical protein